MEKLTGERLVSLILAARGGDDDAFNTIVYHYTPLINSVITKLTASVDEYYSVACLGLFDAVRTFNVEQDSVTFGLYARILITRRVLDAYESEQSATARLSDRDVERIAVTDSIVSRLERQEEREEFLGKARALLSDYEYRVFLLWLEGRKTAAIAKHLGTSARSVDNAKNRILRKLRDGLGGRRT